MGLSIHLGSVPELIPCFLQMISCNFDKFKIDHEKPELFYTSQWDKPGKYNERREEVSC